MRKYIFVLLLLPSLIFSQTKLLIRTIHTNPKEWDFCCRLKIAALNLGWEVFVNAYEPEKKIELPPDIDFVITLIPTIPYLPGVKNYLALFPPVTKECRELKELYSPYDGFLIFSNKIAQDSALYNCQVWYPTCYRIPYKVVNLKRLAYVFPFWENPLFTSRLRVLNDLLDKTDYFSLYSNSKNLSYYKNSYKGEVPYTTRSLIELLSEEGITLVMNSLRSNESGFPTGRIFEAAAASTVIICERNDFAIKYFGDSVLYFDVAQNGKTMFEQINAHMQWIFSHPEKALAKAKRAHEIFVQKFLLEHQLLKLKKMHEKHR